MEIKTLASDQELQNRDVMLELLNRNQVVEKEKLSNVGLFLKRQELTKFLFFNDIYSQITNVHGVLMEFGVRWGQNLVTLNNLRGIYEPYNHSRKLIGFDTFSGFPNVDKLDGEHPIIKEGSFSVTSDYEVYLEQVLRAHELECPLSHIKKNFLVKGDATKTLKTYLDEHPETIIAFAYFDFDIYKPTKDCLELIRPYLTKGSIIGFDELGDGQFPGETIALKETLGLNNVKIERSKFSGIQSYIKIT
jgi:hypothetical protein